MSELEVQYVHTRTCTDSNIKKKSGLLNDLALYTPLKTTAKPIFIITNTLDKKHAYAYLPTGDR
jgi:hypothetical protein